MNPNWIQYWINEGRVTSSLENPLTAREPLLDGFIDDAQDGVKVPTNGAEHLNTFIHITPSGASKTAILVVEKLGGTIACSTATRLDSGTTFRATQKVHKQRLPGRSISFRTYSRGTRATYRSRLSRTWMSSENIYLDVCLLDLRQRGFPPAICPPSRGQES
ncbi:50S ribosomal protein L15, mitochondrial [Phanerochaete sordida]|uniref:50S ribosomal protein L15, mitochondrial n=1 Tax=Phanerochaete sordida TaxID=48140 RepID=A0A9P3LMI9_9APHY|nr:50S ribosomal protein L15, mitochondrial [Phanerochaete sordida]